MRRIWIACLCLAHGNALVHDVANRARFLTHSELGIARLFPLCVYLCVDSPLLREEIIRILLCLCTINQIFTAPMQTHVPSS